MEVRNVEYCMCYAATCCIVCETSCTFIAPSLDVLKCSKLPKGCAHGKIHYVSETTLNHIYSLSLCLV